MNLAQLLAASALPVLFGNTPVPTAYTGAAAPSMPTAYTGAAAPSMPTAYTGASIPAPVAATSGLTTV